MFKSNISYYIDGHKVKQGIDLYGRAVALILEVFCWNSKWICLCVKIFLMAGILGYYSLSSSMKYLMVPLGKVSAVIFSILFLLYPSGNMIFL